MASRSSMRWGDGDDAKDAAATELNIPTTANYISHESVLVDTPDHEDHFFRCVRYMYLCAPALCCSLHVLRAGTVFAMPPRRCLALCGVSTPCSIVCPRYASSLCLLAMPLRYASSPCPRGAAFYSHPLTLRPPLPPSHLPPPSLQRHYVRSPGLRVPPHRRGRYRVALGARANRTRHCVVPPRQVRESAM